MLDINLIRQNPDIVKKGISSKNVNPKLVDDFLELDKKWREFVKNIDDLRSEQKKLSQNREIEQAKKIKDKIQELENNLRQTEIKREEILEQFPNLPFNDVPVGKDESENVILREFGKKPVFDFEPKDYMAIAQSLDLIDTERASKVSGSRFGYIKNELVLIEFALVKLAMDLLLKEKFSPVVPPVMIKPEMLKGMGKSKFIKDGDAFYVPEDNLYLVGSSEHTIGSMYSDEVLNESELPKRYAGFSTCFRREAGSYGKDTKGILRVHQFDKVEMFSFVKPEESQKEHLLMLSLQEKLMQLLGLHYRVVEICTGDMGWPDAKQYDIETWLPAQGKYRETNSTSNTTDYQARGINAKYRKADNKTTEFVHTLNGTAFAIGRTLIAIIENYQTKNGTILVPEVLQTYVGLKEIKR